MLLFVKILTMVKGLWEEMGFYHLNFLIGSSVINLYLNDHGDT